MKNNFLNLNPLKPYDVDVRMPGGSDYLDLSPISKIEPGILTEPTEDLREMFEGSLSEDLDSEEDSSFLEEMWQERNFNGFFYAGYVDCMDEAIRFLVEEENISPEHPVVQNLRDHLEKCKEKIFGAFAHVDSLQGTRPRGEDFRFLETYTPIKDCRDFD